MPSQSQSRQLMNCLHALCPCQSVDTLFGIFHLMFPASQLQGKQLQHPTKNTSNVANVNIWEPWGSNSSKFSWYFSEASAARIRTGTEHQRLQCHLTSTPAASGNFGSGRSRKRRNSVESKKKIERRPPGFRLERQATWQDRGRRWRNTSQESPPRREHDRPRG